MNKLDMLAAVLAEIEDRSTQARESGEAEEYAEELKGLQELKELVENESTLSFDQCQWLCYLCAAYREAQVREELED